MGKLSVVISAYNEEKNIKDCIDSLRDLADEIIVVDNSSTDKTAEIAKKLGANIFTQENDPSRIDLQKNFGFSKATCDWILSLDADERVTPELTSEIKSNIQHPTSNIQGYEIPRKNIIFGKWIEHTGWYPDYQLRLFKKGKGKFEEKHVHEMIKLEGEPGKLVSPIIHYNYGLHGLVLSLLMAFYHLIVFVNIWEKLKFKQIEDKNLLANVKEEFVKGDKEVFFWFSKVSIDSTRNPVKK